MQVRAPKPSPIPPFFFFFFFNTYPDSKTASENRRRPLQNRSPPFPPPLSLSVPRAASPSDVLSEDLSSTGSMLAVWFYPCSLISVCISPPRLQICVWFLNSVILIPICPFFLMTVGSSISGFLQKYSDFCSEKKKRNCYFGVVIRSISSQETLSWWF